MHSSGNSNPCLVRDAAFRPLVMVLGQHNMAEMCTKLSHSPLGWESRKEKEETGSHHPVNGLRLEDLLRALTVLGPSSCVTQEPAFNIWFFVKGGIQIKKCNIGVFCFLFIWFYKEFLCFIYLRISQNYFEHSLSPHRSLLPSPSPPNFMFPQSLKQTSQCSLVVS